MLLLGLSFNNTLFPYAYHAYFDTANTSSSNAILRTGWEHARLPFYTGNNYAHMHPGMLYYNSQQMNFAEEWILPCNFVVYMYVCVLARDLVLVSECVRARFFQSIDFSNLAQGMYPTSTMEGQQRNTPFQQVHDYPELQPSMSYA